jgi:hypothetical protein
LAGADDSTVILVADGLTPDTLDDAIRSGDVPELAALAASGTNAVITTVFPSVTGLAYIPLLTGKHPAEAGIPGLRWYDRSRRISGVIGHSRSYVGPQIRSMNDDLAPGLRTSFERVGGHALGMASVITRGLPAPNRLDQGFFYSSRVIHAHLTGDVRRWAAIEDTLAETLVRRIRREKPRFVFAAFTSGDKAAHRDGAASPEVVRSLKLVDDVARSIRVDAERDGRWKTMKLWIASDHGHSLVHHHCELADELRNLGVRVRSHPWTLPDRSEVALMVGGNCMAHLYLDLEHRRREDWSRLRDRWSARLEPVWAHPAIDLIAMRSSPGRVELRRGAATAEIAVDTNGFSYRPLDGNPLEVDPFESLAADAAHEHTVHAQYPDAVVQLARLVLADRSGDVVISASPGWDLRRRYEPMAHVSSHGALHAAHMLVPLLGNRRFHCRPRRTTDVFEGIGVKAQSPPISV